MSEPQRIDLHLYVHTGADPETTAKLDQIIAALAALDRKETTIMATLDDVTQKLQDETNAETAVITLLGTLKADLDAAKNDPAKIQAIADKLDANKAALAAAIVANTPAAPAPAPAPTDGSAPASP